MSESILEIINSFSTSSPGILYGLSGVALASLLVRIIRRAVGLIFFSLSTPFLVNHSGLESLVVFGYEIQATQASVILLGIALGFIFPHGIRRMSGVFSRLLSFVGFVLLAIASVIIFNYFNSGQAEFLNEAKFFILSFSIGATGYALVRMLLTAIPLLAWSSLTIVLFSFLIPESIPQFSNLLDKVPSIQESYNTNVSLKPDQLLSKFTDLRRHQHEL